MNKKILWCPQHQITEAQASELTEKGEIINFKVVNPELFAAMANIPVDISQEGIDALANSFVRYICKEKFDRVVWPLGSPELTHAVAWICAAYLYEGQTIVPTFTFARSERVSEDVIQPDGSVKKVATFKHVRFS